MHWVKLNWGINLLDQKAIILWSCCRNTISCMIVRFICLRIVVFLACYFWYDVAMWVMLKSTRDVLHWWGRCAAGRRFGKALEVGWVSMHNRRCFDSVELFTPKLSWSKRNIFFVNYLGNPGIYFVLFVLEELDLVVRLEFPCLSLYLIALWFFLFGPYTSCVHGFTRSF